MEIMKYVNMVGDYIQYNAPVTLSMFFISFLVWMLGALTKGKSTNKLFSTTRGSLLNPLTYIRLFTHVLGHSDWNHFASNYMKILILGPLIEEKYGSINLLVMIAITAFITGVVNFLKDGGSLRGASGIAFMFIVLSAFVNVTENKVPLTLILVILFYIVDEIRDLGKKDNVAHYGHIIGAICGVVFGFAYLYGDIFSVVSLWIAKLYS